METNAIIDVVSKNAEFLTNVLQIQIDLLQRNAEKSDNFTNDNEVQNGTNLLVAHQQYLLDRNILNT